MTHTEENTEQVAEAIRRLGFVRWHERTLIVAHLHLVTCLLGLLLIPLAMEAFSDPANGWQWVQRYGLMIGGALLGFFGLNRYLINMVRAWRRSERARCPDCNAYGAFDVQAHGSTPVGQEGGDGAPVDEGGGWIRVQCRKCGKQWNI